MIKLLRIGLGLVRLWRRKGLLFAPENGVGCLEWIIPRNGKCFLSEHTVVPGNSPPSFRGEHLSVGTLSLTYVKTYIISIKYLPETIRYGLHLEAWEGSAFTTEHKSEILEHAYYQRANYYY